MAKRMDKLNKRENYKRFLAGDQRETKHENKFDTKLHSNGYRPQTHTYTVLK
jgi:hypothetical protein